MSCFLVSVWAFFFIFDASWSKVISSHDNWPMKWHDYKTCILYCYAVGWLLAWGRNGRRPSWVWKVYGVMVVQIITRLCFTVSLFHCYRWYWMSCYILIVTCWMIDSFEWLFLIAESIPIVIRHQKHVIWKYSWTTLSQYSSELKCHRTLHRTLHTSCTFYESLAEF